MKIKFVHLWVDPIYLIKRLQRRIPKQSEHFSWLICFTEIRKQEFSGCLSDFRTFSQPKYKLYLFDKNTSLAFTSFMSLFIHLYLSCEVYPPRPYHMGCTTHSVRSNPLGFHIARTLYQRQVNRNPSTQLFYFIPLNIP